MNTRSAGFVDDLLTIPEVAEKLRICVRGVYRRIDEGVLPRPLKIGRRSVIPLSAVVEYLFKLGLRK